MPTPKIRIRSYKVGFGDCLLVSIPDDGATRHLLIDFGNAPGKGGSNEAFPEIAKDIWAQTDGHLDAVVMTHEHLDHMEGFYSQRKIFDQMKIDQVWTSLPSHPDYYENYPLAKKHRSLVASAAALAQSFRSRPGLVLAPSFETLLLNNLSNQDRIDYVRKLAGTAPHYLSRGSQIRIASQSSTIRITVLAPEKDVSVYYCGTHQLSMMASMLSIDEGQTWAFPRVARAADERPRNLTWSDWHQLRHAIQTGLVSAIRTIDRAQNNTSLVLLVEAHGKRLLFPADAETESWQLMAENAGGHLGPVNFLKVSHHGSRNGTPICLLNQILPVQRRAEAAVLLSTKKNVYGTTNPVPDDTVVAELKQRCTTFASTDETTAPWVDVEI